MSTREFLMWQEYYKLAPFGQWRDNWHAAIIAQTIAAVNTPKNRKPPNIEDYIYMDIETYRARQTKKVMDSWRELAKQSQANEGADK